MRSAYTAGCPSVSTTSTMVKPASRAGGGEVLGVATHVGGVVGLGGDAGDAQELDQLVDEAGLVGGAVVVEVVAHAGSVAGSRRRVRRWQNGACGTFSRRRRRRVGLGVPARDRLGRDPGEQPPAGLGPVGLGDRRDGGHRASPALHRDHRRLDRRPRGSRRRAARAGNAARDGAGAGCRGPRCDSPRAARRGPHRRARGTPRPRAGGARRRRGVAGRHRAGGDGACPRGDRRARRGPRAAELEPVLRQEVVDAVAELVGRSGTGDPAILAGHVEAILEKAQ